jgi:hypothetical protein
LALLIRGDPRRCQAENPLIAPFRFPEPALQVDEIWAFCYAKQKNVPTATAAPEGAGDVWTWTAIDADSKLVMSWMVGDRSGETARKFINDLAKRLANGSN